MPKKIECSFFNPKIVTLLNTYFWIPSINQCCIVSEFRESFNTCSQSVKILDDANFRNISWNTLCPITITDTLLQAIGFEKSNSKYYLEHMIIDTINDTYQVTIDNYTYPIKYIHELQSINQFLNKNYIFSFGEVNNYIKNNLTIDDIDSDFLFNFTSLSITDSFLLDHNSKTIIHYTGNKDVFEEIVSALSTNTKLNKYSLSESSELFRYQVNNTTLCLDFAALRLSYLDLTGNSNKADALVNTFIQKIKEIL